MGDLVAILALCWLVGIAAYFAGRNDGMAKLCDERDASGRHVLQRVTPVGDVPVDLRLIIDNHNRILQKLCNR